MKATFVGGGNMASALIGALERGGAVAAGFKVIEPLAKQRSKLEQRFRGIATYENAVLDAFGGSELVVFAVKPQQMRIAAQSAAAHLTARPVVLSIAAGIRLHDLSRWLG